MNDELAVWNPNETIMSDLSVIDEKDLSKQISGQFKRISDLDKSTRKAFNSAKKARESADSAFYLSAGLFSRRAAIEGLQCALVDLSEAVQLEAEALKVSFEFQSRLAEVSKFLFGLGICNIAHNRFVVRELEMRLKGASKKELSVLARQELMMVVAQLKEQEDMLRRLENIQDKITTFDEDLKAKSQEIQQVDQLLQTQLEFNVSHTEQLKDLQDKNNDLIKQLKEQKIEVNLFIDEMANFKTVLDSNSNKITAFDEDLKAKSQEIQQVDQLLQTQLEFNMSHTEQLEDLQDKNNDLTKQLKEQKIKVNLFIDEMADFKMALDSKSNITLAIAVIAFALSIMHFFI